jgi:hypothetical protein
MFGWMTVVAVIASFAILAKCISILLFTFALPFFVLQFWNRGGNLSNACVGIAIAFSMVPLYVALLGPFYMFHVSGYATPYTRSVGVSFFWPIFSILKQNNSTLFKPLWEHYIDDWIQMGLNLFGDAHHDT